MRTAPPGPPPSWPRGPAPPLRTPELDAEEAELAADFDEEEADDAALQLMAAIEEADMAEEGDGLGVEVSAETEAAYEAGYEAGSYAEDEAEAGRSRGGSSRPRRCRRRCRRP